MYLPVTFWCLSVNRNWPLKGRFLLFFFNQTNQIWSFTIFNGSTYVMWGKSGHCGLFIGISHTFYWLWSLIHKITRTASFSASAGKKRFRSRFQSLSAIFGKITSLMQCVTLWTLQSNSYAAPQHWLSTVEDAEDMVCLKFQTINGTFLSHCTPLTEKITALLPVSLVLFMYMKLGAVGRNKPYILAGMQGMQKY